MTKRYGIIHCYDAPKWWPIGSMVWKNSLASIPSSSHQSGGRNNSEVEDKEEEEEDWLIYDLPGKGELPKSEDNLDAIIITGSARGVYEDIPWIHTLTTYLQAQYQAYKENRSIALPIVGGCFGAQIIGHALGGLVKPQGFYLLCAEEIRLTDEYRKLPWVIPTDGTSASPSSSASSDIPQLPPTTTTVSTWSSPTLSPSSSSVSPTSTAPPNTVRLLESHGDCVVTLPPEGIVLGSSGSCKHEFFLIGNCLGIQSHPEFDVENIIMPIIWPSAIGIGVKCPRLTKEQAEQSQNSFTLPRHETYMLQTIKQFMRSRGKL